MVKEICHGLRHKLEDLPFLDVLAGLAQTVIDTKYADGEGEDGTKIQKKMPVSYDVFKPPVPAGLMLGKERTLVPDAGKRSIIYFEDNGTTPDAGAHVRQGAYAFITNVRVVCWLNKEKLVKDKYAEITAPCQMHILKRLINKDKALNGGNELAGFTRGWVTLQRVPPQDAQIFSRYNYAEDELQYLRPPYEYFALDLLVKYQVAAQCLPYINLAASNK